MIQNIFFSKLILKQNKLVIRVWTLAKTIEKTKTKIFFAFNRFQTSLINFFLGLASVIFANLIKPFKTLFDEISTVNRGQWWLLQVYKKNLIRKHCAIITGIQKDQSTITVHVTGNRRLETAHFKSGYYSEYNNLASHKSDAVFFL